MRTTPVARAGIFAHALCTALVVFSSVSAREPSILLTELAAGRWRVEYQLTTPARALRFSRSLADYREQAWRPDDAAFEFSPDGLSVRRADGDLFDRVAYEVDARSLGLASNYEPFLSFSDSGVLAYTGYYFACADAPCTTSASWRVRVEPMKRRRATRGAPATPGALSFTDKGDGSYVYVGVREIVEAESFMALADPAAPAGVLRVMNTALPRIMAYYERRLSGLPRKPVFFVSMGGARGADAFESRGTALPDQVSINLAGPRWAHDRGTIEPGFLPWYFAHEAAHLFQRIEDRPKADDFMAEGWIHEGGAEALAAIAVSALQPSLRAYVDERIASAAQDCDEGLRALGAPLNASIDRGAPDNYYACGLAMQIAVDRDVREASQGSRDLFDVWRAFLNDTGNGATWTEATFIRAARAQGAREETLALVSSLARKRAAWRAGSVRARLLAAPAGWRR